MDTKLKGSTVNRYAKFQQVSDLDKYKYKYK